MPEVLIRKCSTTESLCTCNLDEIPEMVLGFTTAGSFQAVSHVQDTEALQLACFGHEPLQVLHKASC